jgi:hypothetical protein
MPNILDRIAAQRYGEVHPQTVQEFFGLQLARKLGDLEAARHYLEMVAEHSEENLLVAYRRALAASAQQSENLPRGFHTALNRMNVHGPEIGEIRLLAIKVERRTVSAAVFVGRHLEDTETRHLSSVRSRAEASAVSFIRCFTGNFEIESVTMECPPPDHAAQRSVLHRLATAALSDQLFPLSLIPKSDLIQAFGHPAARSRREVRETIQAIWPILDPEPSVLDAVALGLYVQTERLFTPLA